MAIGHSRAERENDEKLREMGYVPGPTGDSFSDFITMKVIAQRRSHQFGNPFGANATAMVFAQYKELLRNVCVRVDPFRMAELDALTEVLDCNKQEFVLELLVAGMEQAKAALRAAGLERAFDDAVDKRLDEAGFSVAPQSASGFWQTHYRGKPIVNKQAEHHEKMAGAISSTIGDALPESDS